MDARGNEISDDGTKSDARLAPLRIGLLKISTPLVLAPMAGYTDSTFRSLCLQQSCGLVFTEIVSAHGIAMHNTRALSLLRTSEHGRPIAAHIYGSDSATMAAAAHEVELLGRFDLIDINAGCPVPKIVRKGAGVALMRSPDLIYSIVREVSEAVSLPVTVKTRVGISPSDLNISEFAQAAEEGGADALFLHARPATAGHAGPIELELLEKTKEERSMPVVGNGGIRDAKDVIAMLATGVDGVMIGKEAIGNPWIFSEIAAALAGTPYSPPTNRLLLETISVHLRGLYAAMVQENNSRRRRRRFTERAACHRVRGHLVGYLRRSACSRDALREILKQESLDDLLGLVERVLMNQPDSATAW